MMQCFERCGIDRENDLLITGGDICDGWPDVYECVEELLLFKNRIDIVGNHDKWFMRWLKTGHHPACWSQGGMATAMSYYYNSPIIEALDIVGGDYTKLSRSHIPASHEHFFFNQKDYYLDDKKRL